LSTNFWTWKKNGEAAPMITKNFKQLAGFSVDLEAVEFSPEEGISDQKFRKSIEKPYFEIRKFLKK
jgi:uncharacterized protein YdhG (YjbR/CyaY superfamily)